MKSIRRLAAVLACTIVIAVAAGPGRVDASSGSARAAWDPASARLRPVSIALGAAHLQWVNDDEPFRFHGPIIRVGQDYTLRGNETVRDVHTVFGDVTIEGHVEGEVVVILGSVRLSTTAVVEGSLVVLGGSATIDRGAAVRDNLVVVGGTLTAPADFSPGGQHVVIGSPGLGDALNALVPWITRGLLWGRLIVPDLAWIWMLLGIVLFVYLAVNTLFDRSVRASADAIVQRPFSTFLLGLLVLVLSVPALAILAATLIGIAVVPFVLCAMFVGALVGKAGVARAIGRTVVAQSSPESKLQSLGSFLIGFVVIAVAYMVPVLGIVTWALTSVFGVGAAAAALRAALRREHPPRERPAAAPIAPGPATPDAAGQAAVPPPGARLAEATPGAGASAPPFAGELSLFPRASFFDRVAAFALDCLLIGVAIQVLNLGRHNGSFPLLLFAYHVAFWAWKGTTLGGIVVGLRVIRTQGPDLRFADALVRGLGAILSLAALGIGCFWMLQDAERQMWHDKIAGTVVVKVPRELALA